MTPPDIGENRKFTPPEETGWIACFFESYWPRWLAPEGLKLSINPDEAHTDALERKFRYHAFQVPLLRFVAILFLALMVVMHAALEGAPPVQRLLRFLPPALAYWGACFALVRLLYKRVDRVDLGNLILCADIFLVLFTIHVSGSGRSLLLPVMLLPISFIALSSFRVSVVASVLFPLAYLGYMRWFGQADSWPAELAKSFILLASNLYLALTSLVQHGWRGRLKEALSVSRDLIRLLEDRGEDLAQAMIKAEQASVSKSVFLSNMSHELRTPLNAILGYAQLLRRRKGLEPDVEEQLGRIQRSGEHLLELINDVLTISKIEAVGIVPAPIAFAPSVLFRSIEDIIRIRAQEKGLELRLDIQPNYPEWVQGDENKLRQVLINLLGNAAKFTHHGSIVLQAGWEDGQGRFCVADTGPGIPEGELESLFQRFSQAAQGRGASEGTGLGLHISQAIVKALGGEIRVESEVGQGSRFSFRIPLPYAATLASAPAPESAGVLAPGQRTARILVVDDREENRDLLARVLEEAGLSALSAADGPTALEMVEEYSPDLVFLDIRMPGMDGFEVIRRIREREARLSLARLPVSAFTASVLDNEREAVLARGFDDYIRKPFKAKEITDCLERHLGLRFIPVAAERPEASAALDLGEVPAWPAPAREALLRALDIGDLDEILGILDGLASQAGVQPIRELAKRYRFEELKDLLTREPTC